jgi:hypothetical protein
MPLGQSLFENLATPPDYTTHRVSSHDREGGNQDWISIEPGETKTLAELDGPGAITHLWNTVDAEIYYPRLMVLRFYWDGQATPSVEVPLGDFFGVGHGLNIPFQSLPVAVSSEGRARNCYWFMPFQRSAKITLTHEGFQPVSKFYYYIDYRRYTQPQPDPLYFHAQYRQATPNPPINLSGKNTDGKANYLLLETQGRGLYVGSLLSVQLNADGWFGEGDDMFFIDGESTPSLIGTGTEDYFNDAWGFRAFSFPYHGVPLWEGYQKGHRATAYKWHLHDPVAFSQSLRATVEHGHANDRQDDFYSVAYWYQTLPSPEPPALPGPLDRLPDEGQFYAKGLFINRELETHISQKRWDSAFARIDQHLQENERADEAGYWSLRKGVLLKQTGQIKQAQSAFETAVQRSKKEDPHQEWQAGEIQAQSLAEAHTLASAKEAQLMVLSPAPFEIFLDEKPIAKHNGHAAIQTFIIELSGGSHLLAVACEHKSRIPWFALQLSHRKGYLVSNATWKVNTRLTEGWNTKKFDDSTWTNAASLGSTINGPWKAADPRSAFLQPFLTAELIGAPSSMGETQALYFRTEFRP